MLLSKFFKSSISILDFNLKSKVDNCKVTNDVVMGGVSSALMTLDSQGNAVFSGKVSTENNGGFAMVRLPVSVILNRNSSKIQLHVKGDGKLYQFRIKSRLSEKHWYIQSFQTSKEWQTIELELSEFYPSFRGRRLELPNFKSNQIQEIAFFIGNKKTKSFKLLVDSVKISN